MCLPKILEYTSLNVTLELKVCINLFLLLAGRYNAYGILIHDNHIL